MSKWIDVFNDNYYNRSDAARQIDDLMKKNYKGHKYVPWSVMVRLLYTMDDNAILEVMTNDNGGHVFSDLVETYTSLPDRKNPEVTLTTKTYTYAHFVKVKCTFLGKEFIENYPVQDNSYNPTNYIDSNMINKSIQRAKAKVISTATGLGFMLYETGDLQFEDDNKPTNKGKSTVTEKVTKAPVRTVVDTEDEDTATVVNDDALDLATYIVDNKDTITKTLQQINASLVKTYKVSVNPEVDDTRTIADKLRNVANVKLFGETIKKLHKDEKEGK